ncbi:DcaP family trimeric outer membrane transporter [Acinetobacter gyllenbergii]|uniref:DcaP family trimeric outer membrane transporter n=1 Tax=Acinetobacter gyllenbergii TaxID=134534 RepID=UPI00362838DE
MGFSKKWTSKLKSTFSIAGINFKDKTPYAINNPIYNESLYNVVANFIYTPVNNINLGMEYTYGQRENFQGEEGTISRVNLLTRYNF